MAQITIFAAGASQTANSQTGRRIGHYLPDVFTTETITLSNVITSEPIESGEYVQDHVFTEPLIIEASGMQSEVAYPIAQSGSGVTVDRGRAVLAFEVLRELHETKTPFDVVLGLGLFPNMLVERIGIEQSVSIGDALSFSVRLKQVKTVDSLVSASTRRVVTPAKVKPRATGTPAPKTPPDSANGTNVGKKVGVPANKGRVPAKPVPATQAPKASEAVERIRFLRKRVGGG
jgi:hypothetical protein